MCCNDAPADGEIEVRVGASAPPPHPPFGHPLPVGARGEKRPGYNAAVDGETEALVEASAPPPHPPFGHPLPVGARGKRPGRNDEIMPSRREVLRKAGGGFGSL